jgi:pimeloyl-ACP methyl ester carboxylesterase
MKLVQIIGAVFVVIVGILYVWDPTEIESPLPAELREWEVMIFYFRRNVKITQSKGKYVNIFGHQVFVLDSGKKSSVANDTLLILHGFPSSSYDYHAVLQDLHERFPRIVLFDFIGFGLSDKPKKWSYSLIDHADIALLVWKSLGIESGHLLSHDMGDSYGEVHLSLDYFFAELQQN